MVSKLPQQTRWTKTFKLLMGKQLCKQHGNKASLPILGLGWIQAHTQVKPTQRVNERALENVSGVTAHTTQVSGRMELGMERESSSQEKEQSTTECLMMTLETAQERWPTSVAIKSLVLGKRTGLMDQAKWLTAVKSLSMSSTRMIWQSQVKLDRLKQAQSSMLSLQTSFSSSLPTFL